MTRVLRRVGVDWGSGAHQVCRIDGEEEPKQRGFPHTSEGLNALVAFVVEGEMAPEQMAVAIEVNHGAVVEALLAKRLPVYSINPKLLDRLRDRFSPAGAKDDRRDAFVLASCVESDAHAFRRIEPGNEENLRLQAATRLRGDLKSQFGADANRLWSELRDYRPGLLVLCPGADEPWLWALIEKAPSPSQGAKLTRASIGAVLKRHRIRRLTIEDVQTVLRKDVLSLRPVYIESHVARVLVLTAKLKLAQTQIDKIEAEIKTELTERVQSEKKTKRRDLTILLSLPGFGPLTTATALGESGDAFERRDYNALRSLCGAAPITKQSGGSRYVVMRQFCQPRLRVALHISALQAIRTDPKFHDLYVRARARGQTVGRAIRNIVDRLLCLAVQLLRKNELYDITHRQLVPEVAAAS
jgi:transposase